MQVMRSRTRTLFMGITNIPMLNADIVTGVSLMLLFIAFRLTLGFKRSCWLTLHSISLM